MTCTRYFVLRIQLKNVKRFVLCTLIRRTSFCCLPRSLNTGISTILLLEMAMATDLSEYDPVISLKAVLD